ncbi:hypothetical protein COLO4_21538 [Corchorus olitorius]|uniref:Uncharacterized protein n=1 Tax=Corchorus olitorius TaxID=93759 RepID=A0A1R3ISQ9_9ROSI|nr:hypothetical protein COLO4_21538 [Corchorus olitorius]
MARSEEAKVVSIRLFCWVFQKGHSVEKKVDWGG